VYYGIYCGKKRPLVSGGAVGGTWRAAGLDAFRFRTGINAVDPTGTLVIKP
jgi:hypothetical protein